MGLRREPRASFFNGRPIVALEVDNTVSEASELELPALDRSAVDAAQAEAEAAQQALDAGRKRLADLEARHAQLNRETIAATASRDPRVGELRDRRAALATEISDVRAGLPLLVAAAHGARVGVRAAVIETLLDYADGLDDLRVSWLRRAEADSTLARECALAGLTWLAARHDLASLSPQHAAPRMGMSALLPASCQRLAGPGARPRVTGPYPWSGLLDTVRALDSAA